MKVNKNFWILLSLLFLLIVINAYLNDPSVERTVFFVGTIIFFSGLMTLFSNRKFSLIRSVKETRQQVGQFLNEKYEIENRNKIPIFWITIEDYSGISKKKQQIITWIPGKTKRSFYNLTYLTHRGVFTLGPTQVVYGDPFGLFSRVSIFQSTQKIIILPSFEKVTSFPEPTGSDTGGEARKARNLEINPYAISVRDYHLGDPLKRIHWKYTAKMDKLMAKEFEDDPQSKVWILLDGDINNRIHSVEKTSEEAELNSIWRSQNRINTNYFENSFELGISLTASLCDYYVSNNQIIGFFSNGKQNIVFPPEGGVRQLDKILEVLASLKNDSYQSILDAVINHSAVTSKANTLITISANTSVSFINAIQQLSLRGFQMILLSIDPSSFDISVEVEDFYDNVQQAGVRSIRIRNNIPAVIQLPIKSISL